MKTQCAILWTGGKDSALAMHDAMAAGYTVNRLVTFAPKKPNFLAHPIPIMQAQAKAMGLPHRIVEVGHDIASDYRAAISRLLDEGITTLVTGDIDLVQGMPNFVRQCCDGLNVGVLMPLWHADRLAVLRRLVDLGFEVIFSLVKEPWFANGDWVGRRIDASCIADLQALHVQNGIDLCGENGEYHSLVLNAPMFKNRIELELGQSVKTEKMWHLPIAVKQKAQAASSLGVRGFAWK
jgi:diphthine-ammonia ligase